MTKIYSYILKNDSGASPNPFWGICTLTICKPAIRRTANIGDWVIGTGSKNSKLKDGTFDLSDSIVYAMVITHIKTLWEYDESCKRDGKRKSLIGERKIGEEKSVIAFMITQKNLIPQ